MLGRGSVAVAVLLAAPARVQDAAGASPAQALAAVDSAVRAVLWAMLPLPVLVAAQAYRLAAALRRTQWRRPERTLLAIHTVAATVLVLWLAYWRVLFPGA